MKQQTSIKNGATILSSEGLDLILDAADSGNVLITGPTGVGKTHFLNTVIKHASKRKGPYKFVKLDKYGKKVDDKFIIKDFPLAKDHIIYEGDYKSLIKGGQQSTMHLSLLVILIPDLLSFRKIQAAKAKDALNMDVPQRWIDGWVANSKISKEDFESSFQEQASLIKSSFTSPFYVIMTNTVDSEVSKGWAQ